MQHLRQQHPTVKISVEVEKPGREGLQDLAALANVVFYSKSWAQVLDLSPYKDLEWLTRSREMVTNPQKNVYELKLLSHSMRKLRALVFFFSPMC